MSIQSAMLNAAGSLKVFSRVLDVTQNNVTNASTPGYVKQTQTLEAMPFDAASGAMGGVRAGDVESARDEYSEQAVRRETTSLGLAQQNVESLTGVQSAFDISDNSGLAGALSDLYSSFSAWGATPTDSAACQAVIDSAGKVAQAFHQTSQALTSIRDDTQTQLGNTVNTVNQLTAQIADYNLKAAQASGNDSAVESQINAALEELSQYANITAMPQAGGSYDVLLDGQIPLVLGGRQYQLSSAVDSSASPGARILSGSADVTAKVDGGQLGALLDVYNSVLPASLGDASQAGDLNVMAQQFADSVNGILGGGTPGLALFSYDASNPNAAQTISVDSSVTAGQLAAVPVNVPLALSGLASASQDALGGSTFTEFYGQMASSVGSKLSAATDQQETQQAAVAQAKNLRQQTSGVSLDEEAMTLIEFQRAYEASSKLVTTLDQITQDTIDMLQTFT
jgi:flagellar hook-associated protein 1 FlgK